MLTSTPVSADSDSSDTALPALSSRILNLRASPIRETLSLINRPGMVSFAGGLPSPESFPVLDLSPPAEILQYGASEGESELRARIAEDLRGMGLRCTAEQVLILSGSQQGIDLVAKLFIDAGTEVAVESPTYLAALQVFRFFGATFRSFDMDSIETLDWQSPPAFAYAIPTFQNPTGHCYSHAQRQSLAAACDRHHVPLFEDDPYRDLVFGECERRPACAFLESAPWIYQGSFSKTLAPGLRLGYLAASPELVPFLLRLKQAADLHSNRLSQWLVLQQLQHPQRSARLVSLAEAYRTKRDQFEQQLRINFEGIATWQTPQGGLFFWLTLKEKRDTRLLLPQAIAQNVAFMPGEYFYPDSEPARGTLRLNFSHASEPDMRRGLRCLADLIRA